MPFKKRESSKRGERNPEIRDIYRNVPNRFSSLSFLIIAAIFKRRKQKRKKRGLGQTEKKKVEIVLVNEKERRRFSSGPIKGLANIFLCLKSEVK